MTPDALLLGPVSDVRDAVESYLADGIVIDGWRRALMTAAERLADLGDQRADNEVSRLSRLVADLADHVPQQGVTGEAQQVSEITGRLLNRLDVPGLPLRTDDDWSF